MGKLKRPPGRLRKWKSWEPEAMAAMVEKLAIFWVWRGRDQATQLNWEKKKMVKLYTMLVFNSSILTCRNTAKCTASTPPAYGRPQSAHGSKHLKLNPYRWSSVWRNGKAMFWKNAAKSNRCMLKHFVPFISGNPWLGIIVAASAAKVRFDASWLTNIQKLFGGVLVSLHRPLNPILFSKSSGILRAQSAMKNQGPK